MALKPLSRFSKSLPQISIPGFRDFTLAREIVEACWFSTICLSIIELLVINNYTQTALKFVFDTYVFFTRKTKKKFESVKTFRKICEGFIGKDSKIIKELIYGDELFLSFERLQTGFGRKSIRSVKNLNKFFRYAGIKAYEKRLNCNDLIWGSKEENFSVTFVDFDGKLWFVHQNSRIKLNMQEVKLSAEGFIEDQITALVCEDWLEVASESEAVEVEVPKDSTFFIQKIFKHPDSYSDSYKPDQVSFPPAYCGSYLCQICSKRLKRTNLFIINPKCCNYHVFSYANAVLPPSKVDYPEPKAEVQCVFCTKPGSKREIVLCICCIIHRYVYKNQLKQFEACEMLDQTTWIDISFNSSNNLVKCGFCDIERNSTFMSSVCNKCGDQVCLICLRKNPFITEGLCSTCNVKRQARFNEI